MVTKKKMDIKIATCLNFLPSSRRLSLGDRVESSSEATRSIAAATPSKMLSPVISKGKIMALTTSVPQNIPISLIDVVYSALLFRRTLSKHCLIVRFL